jgi:probable FeS assembly SUF system protein SufT
MHDEQQVLVNRDCETLMIPSGEKLTLRSGTTVWVTQSLGGSYTVMTDLGYMVRVEGKDGDAIGMAQTADINVEAQPFQDSLERMEEKVWHELRSCFDPEIPVNIVELGLIYDCAFTRLDDGFGIAIRFTLTAPGCGMGEVLKKDIEAKLSSISGIRRVQADLVWDPPWTQRRMSRVARQQLGME